ncbi:MAG: 30S ribosomal protein S6--L-glutamate ligase [Sphingobacteriales bacterium]|nr:MAG: 30S ribosomal protein S6--L-glutamate ligase [Sphingobacteriales bacterium]
MKISILSRNANLYSTRRLVEAAQARGHEVNVLDYLHCNIMVEEGEPSIYYRDKLLETPDAIIPRIGASRTFFGCAVVRQFEMMHVFTSVKSQAIVRSRDKLRSMQILSRHGIGMPKTAFSAHPEQIKMLMKKVGGPPIVIKLLEGTQGKGVVLAESINAAKSALDAFYGLKANILIQEYIKEAGGRDIRVFVVNGKIAGAMVRQGVQGEFRSNLHQGGYAEKIKLSKAEKTMALSAAKALGLAVAGVDLLQSSRGPLLMEVNSSPGLEGIEAATGVDIAGTIIQYIEKNVKRKSRDDVGA